MHYIFNTISAAKKYDKDVTELHNFKTTSNWATPVKHPTQKKWAVLASPKLSFSSREPQQLTTDWFTFGE
jgi:hypothetical protein